MAFGVLGNAVGRRAEVKADVVDKPIIRISEVV